MASLGNGWLVVTGCKNGANIQLSAVFNPKRSPARICLYWPVRRPLRNVRLPAWLFCATCAWAQVITTAVGTDFFFPTQPLPALNAPLGRVVDVALDAKGSVYIADFSNNLVLRVSSEGVLSIVAGNGRQGDSGDGGPAAAASLQFPVGVAVDSGGSVYIADVGNNRIRKVSGGIITTFAGKGGSFGFSGDGGPASAASLSGP